MAVCLLASNLENLLQLLVRERMQVWPCLVVLTVAFILFQPLRNRVVGMHWYAERQQYQKRRSQAPGLIANALATNAACLVLRLTNGLLLPIGVHSTSVESPSLVSASRTSTVTLADWLPMR